MSRLSRHVWRGSQNSRNWKGRVINNESFPEQNSCRQISGGEITKICPQTENHRSRVAPRGVVVAHEIAQQLGLPLDIFLVRKLGVPGYEELAMGAIASGGVRVLNQDVLRSINITRDEIQSIAQREEQELKRRESAYRSNRPQLDIKRLHCNTGR